MWGGGEIKIPKSVYRCERKVRSINDDASIADHRNKYGCRVHIDASIVFFFCCFVPVAIWYDLSLVSEIEGLPTG